MNTWRKIFFSAIYVTIGLLAYRAVKASESNRAGLVLYFGEGQTITHCIEFSEPSLSGYEFLSRSGEPLVMMHTQQGAAVCKIQDIGCPEEDCFCDSPPNYWSYWQLQGQEWVYSTRGALATTVKAGQVEGWAWGKGSPPPLYTFDQICAADGKHPIGVKVSEEATSHEDAPQGRSQPASVIWFGVLVLGLILGLALLVARGRERST